MSSRTAAEGGPRLTGDPRFSAPARHAGAAEHGARSDGYLRTVLEYRRYATFSWDWAWRRCIVFAAFASVIGVWMGAVVGLALENRHFDFAIAIGSTEALIVSMCAGPLAASWIRSRGWSRRREMIGVVAAVILAVPASRACNDYVHRLLVTRVTQTRVTTVNPSALHAIVSSPLPMVLSNYVIFLLLGGGLALSSYFAEQRRLAEEARAREFGELRLQKQEMHLQMLVLQAQIEPHFLFNTLASLRSLIRQDVDRAEAMIDALVEHLRAAIPVFRKSKQHSTLSEQLRICSSYLELMRVRLADRLTYTIDVPGTLRSATFPPLILLTLVENAIKHGIEPKPGPGLIGIHAERKRRVDGPHIRVSVTDNGAGLAAGLGHGVGLSNVRAQLALRYGARATLSLMSGTEGGAVASIEIPELDADESGPPVMESTAP